MTCHHFPVLQSSVFFWDQGLPKVQDGDPSAAPGLGALAFSAAQRCRFWWRTLLRAGVSGQLEISVSYWFQRSSEFYVTLRCHQTWQRKIHYWSVIFLARNLRLLGILYCLVWLPEGTRLKPRKILPSCSVAKKARTQERRKVCFFGPEFETSPGPRAYL